MARWSVRSCRRALSPTGPSTNSSSRLTLRFVASRCSKAAKRREFINVAMMPKAFPRQRPQGCPREDHGPGWAQTTLAVQKLLAQKGNLTKAQAFLEQAEREWLDVYQISGTKSKYCGRGGELQVRRVRDLPVSCARWPRVSTEATWLFR
eukprot:2901155-Pyramimonas_sp.AAC.1